MATRLPFQREGDSCQTARQLEAPRLISRADIRTTDTWWTRDGAIRYHWTQRLQPGTRVGGEHVRDKEEWNPPSSRECPLPGGAQSCPTLWPYWLPPARLLCPWESPGKNPGVDCHILLQGVFLTQGLNLGPRYCRWILHRLSHQGRPREMSPLTSNQFRRLGLTGHTRAQGQLGGNLKLLKTM